MAEACGIDKAPAGHMGRITSAAVTQVDDLGGVPFFTLSHPCVSIDLSTIHHRRGKDVSMRPSEKFPYSNADEYRAWWAENTDVPYGECWCGCGERTSLSKVRVARNGHLAGEPVMYVRWHGARVQRKPNGNGSPSWRGGRSCSHTGGYVRRHCPGHPFASNNNYVFEHRLAMEDHLDRYLWPWELVHHKNRDKTDNRIGNLELTNSSEHAKRHNPRKIDLKMAARLRGLGWNDVRIGKLLGVHSSTVLRGLRGYR